MLTLWISRWCFSLYWVWNNLSHFSHLKRLSCEKNQLMWIHGSQWLLQSSTNTVINHMRIKLALHYKCLATSAVLTNERSILHIGFVNALYDRFWTRMHILHHVDPLHAAANCLWWEVPCYTGHIHGFHPNIREVVVWDNGNKQAHTSTYNMNIHQMITLLLLCIKGLIAFFNRTRVIRGLYKSLGE